MGRSSNTADGRSCAAHTPGCDSTGGAKHVDRDDEVVEVAITRLDPARVGGEHVGREVRVALVDDRLRRAEDPDRLRRADDPAAAGQIDGVRAVCGPRTPTLVLSTGSSLWMSITLPWSLL